MPRKYKTQKRKRTGRRKKSFFKGFLFSAVVFSSILIFSAVGFLLFSPRFQISDVTVTGNKDIAANDIKSAAQSQIKKTFSVMGMDFSTESIFLSRQWGEQFSPSLSGDTINFSQKEFSQRFVDTSH